MICRKCQRVVKKGETTFRCINKACGAHGQQVCESECNVCEHKVIKHDPPCGKKPMPVPPPTQAPEEPTADELNALEDALKAESPLKDHETAPEYPGMSTQLWLYKEALMRWNRAGRPTRSKEEVEQIHEMKCKPCDWYDNGRCKGCGCKVTLGAVAVFNKIKMATESCPKGEW